MILGEGALAALCVEATPHSMQYLAFMIEKIVNICSLIGQSSGSGRPRFQILLLNITHVSLSNDSFI